MGLGGLMRARGILLALLVPVLLLGPASHSVQAATPSASSYLAACAQSGETLSALFLFDRSGSLTGSDPQGVRYTALQIALTELATMDSASGKDLAVEAAVASFDDDYNTVRDVVRWTRVDTGAFAGDQDKQQATITDIVDLARESTPPQGGTNFEAALDGAAQDMADRGGPGQCRVVFWFTDGTFDVGGGEDAARQRMCRQGGLLDQIRKSGIVLVGIQLDADSSDLLPMSEGTDGGSLSCGTVPIPSDWAPGMYIRADDTAALRRIFGSVVGIVQGCTPVEPAGSTLIDPGIRRFRMTLETPEKVSALRLDAPDGTVIAVPPEGTTETDGYTVTAHTDDAYMALEVSLPADRGSGEWEVMTNPATTSSNRTLCVFHDLHLRLADPDQQITAGSPTEIVMEAVDVQDTPVDLSVFADVAVGASAVGPDGGVRTSAATVKGSKVLVKVQSEPTDARLELSVAMNLTTQSGLALSPLSGRFPLQLLLSKEFPVVQPSSQLDLGTAVKVGTTSGILKVIGSPVGPTKVCFGPFSDVSVPQEAAGTVPVISDDCVELQIGESTDVTVSVTPSSAAEGAGTADLSVTLHGSTASGAPPQEVSYAIPVLWRFSDPLNAPVAVAVLVVIGLVSVFLPLLAMGLANLLSARFEVRGMQAGSVPVLVNDAIPRRQTPIGTGPQRLVDVYKDRDPAAVADNPRHFSLFGIDFRAHATANPFGVPSFLATAPPGHRIISSVGLPLPGDRQAMVSPGLGFVMLAVASETDLAAISPEVPVHLVFIVRDTSAFARDPDLADRLATSSMAWNRVSEDWRPDPDQRTDADEDALEAPESGLAMSRPSLDDDYFD